MSDETSIPYYIALVTARELNETTVKKWFTVVKVGLPEGLRSSVQVDSSGHGRVSVPLVCKEAEESFRYYIPLTRNLLEFEAEPIVRRVSREFPDLDFDIMVSKADVEDGPEEQKIEIAHEKYDALCRAFAKRQHEQWVADRLKAGWRYSTELSMANRTSPLLKAWDELPEELRQIDYDHPQALVNLLNDQGYAVVRKEELSAIYSLLSRNP